MKLRANSMCSKPNPRHGASAGSCSGDVEQRARDFGHHSLWLQVNTKNTGAIVFYRAAGFRIVREAVFDIGGGFVMDDYLMAKRV